MVFRNVEIKAKLNDKNSAIEIAKLISHDEGKVLNQRDVFFNSSPERTKLRYIEGKGIELITYSRPDQPGPKLSEFNKIDVEDGEKMEKSLAESMGIRVIVEKQRILFMLDDRTRCHVDTVNDLGDFIELEVLLKEDEPIEVGESIAHRYMEYLNITEEDLISDAYADMLLRKNAKN